MASSQQSPPSTIPESALPQPASSAPINGSLTLPNDADNKAHHPSSNPNAVTGASPPRKRGPGRPITEPSSNRDLEVRRAKARERQRRKRARDKLLLLQKTGGFVTTGDVVTPPVAQLPPAEIPRPTEEVSHEDVDGEPSLAMIGDTTLEPSGAIHAPTAQPAIPNGNNATNGGPSSILVSVPDSPKAPTEEEVKREKIRRAARERQRKHRALMKAKRMSQMEEIQHIPPVGYAQAHPQHAHHPAGHGPPHPHLLMAQEQIMYSEHVAPGATHTQIQAQPPLAEPPAVEPAPNVIPPNPPPPPLPPVPPMPMQPPSGPPPGTSHGQIFANTLMLALSCAPMLKAHAMRTLHMTDGDLQALEQVIAGAWDQWDHMRRFPAQIPPPPNVPLNVVHPPHHPHDGKAVQYADPGPPPAAVPSATSTPVEYFRERFARSLAQPSPYQQPPPARIAAKETASRKALQVKTQQPMRPTPQSSPAQASTATIVHTQPPLTADTSTDALGESDDEGTDAADIDDGDYMMADGANGD
ncbi:hypothetical protein FRB99_002873 [Tulasnella sp. 403]|nr:hypothetical protein FRB99_002873 [Tulasnella sp. 403]